MYLIKGLGLSYADACYSEVVFNSRYYCISLTVNCFNVSSFSFLQVETELIDKLDILVSENKGDEEYKHLFNAM
jgi:hypothetical protein